jgi:hypothetical protein
MMTAAAIFAGPAPALAQQPVHAYSVHFVTGSGGASCDGLYFRQITGIAAKLYTGSYLASKCGESDQFVDGAKTSGAYWLYQRNTSLGNSISYVWELSSPIRNGGTWDLDYCFSNVSCFLVNSGIYDRGPPSRGGNPGTTKSRVAEMMAQRRALQQ